MSKRAFIRGILLLTLPLLAPAKDYPLEFRTLNQEDVKGYRWSYGAVRMLVAEKPKTLKQEPKAVSAHPLYGLFEWPSDKTSMLFRVDESKGDGNGYDRLILDLNQNDDLTDDAVIAPAAGIGSWSAFKGQAVTLFGPIAAPPSKQISAGKPIYYAVLDVRADALEQLRKNPAASTREYLGNLRLKAAWYLETTVELEGRKQNVALIDNDANMRLGDMCRPRITSDGSWYLLAAEGDRLLLDKGGTGTNYQSQCLSQILYSGVVPYKLALAPDCGSLRIEPWPEPLAEVALCPRGQQVRSLGLGWESSSNQWEFIDVGVADGKVKVPPGNYGLWAVSVSAKTQNGEEITAGGGMNAKKIFAVKTGMTNTLRCGAPLDIKVTAQHQGGTASPAPRGFLSSLLNWMGNAVSSETDELRIQAEVVGAGGETYSGFSLVGGQGQRQPPKPAFVITADGKEVASGNLEFG